MKQVPMQLALEALRRRVRRRFIIAFTLLTALVMLPAAAYAQAGGEASVQMPPAILAVDARQNTNATITVRAQNELSTSNVSVSVNDSKVEVTGVKRANEAGSTKLNTVLVLDDSEESGTFAFKQIQTAATAFLKTLQPNESVGIISTGGTAEVKFSLGKNGALAADVVESMKPKGGTELYSAITIAAKMLSNEGTAVNNIVVFSASQDSGRNAATQTALVEAKTSRAAVNVIAVRSDRVTEIQLKSLAQLAEGTGGLIQTATQAGLIPQLATGATNAVRGLYSINVIGEALTPGGNIRIIANGQQLDAGFIAGSVTRGANLAPYETSKPILPFLKTTKGKSIALLLMFAAVLMGAWAIATSVVRTEVGLNSVLQPYTGDGDEEDSGSYAAIFQRAVDITSNLAERKGLVTIAEERLEQASMPLRAAEAITAYAVIVVFAFLGSAVLTRSPLMIIMWTALAAICPLMYVKFKIARRKKKFVQQLPDTLSLLSGTLKAGFSFMQGVEAVSQEVEEPMGTELRRVIMEAQLGRPVEEALDSAAQRMDSEDFAWAVMAVRIQREVGGNLAELLTTVAETMVARQRLKGEIKALTAEGRMSAMILGFLPPGLGMVMYVINKSYMEVLFQETMGMVMLIGASVMMLIGFLWMLKIINIKI